MKTLAIIGIGPRGLYALENLIFNLATSKKELNIIIFESSSTPGAGTVWDTKQPDSNWINITERALKDLNGRPEIEYLGVRFPSFPSYHKWSHFEQSPSQPDTFPPRHKIGTYLNERFNSIVKILRTQDYFTFITSKVNEISFKNRQLNLLTKPKNIKVDYVLLTIGHQPTKRSKQLISWHKHEEKNEDFIVFDNAYPVSKFDDIKNQTHLNIGMRGFGLAMIDVMRALVINNFGNFKILDTSTFKSKYEQKKQQHLKLIPFSLDGLPLVPKPLTPEIDSWFEPTSEEIKNFKSKIERTANGEKSVKNLDFLLKPISKIISRIFLDLKDKALEHDLEKDHLETIILIWLKSDEFKHQLIQDNTIPTYELIKVNIEMALGKRAITLDFCIGQVWRHCQPTLYKSLSHSTLDDDIIKDIISLDDSSKRYTYGPPVESMQQVLALVDANILTLDFINDPEIELTKKGWELKNRDHESHVATVMINSVLASPNVTEINSKLIKELLNDDLIQPVHSKLGIETSKDGKVISQNKEVPIYVLGRLVKGSVIGVDAILECFGERIEYWADEFVRQLD
ncbi:FAD/NAD(P)-binding protein [Psychroserpens sp. Hel_I_66]|uniref:FAD/NAD(P)-binding protein n=1 Tax=Psychroserpens sp. Hel_I_66 TaxID=1250004 RepID=UPI000646809E|nr:FAD/NAD(P)-binding protein [Psychroserpens sp. Hel_I_66]